MTHYGHSVENTHSVPRTEKRLGVTATTAIPVGTIVAYAADAQPPANAINWVMCFGQPLNTADFPELYAVLGGANGETTTSFNIPDLRGMFVRGNSGRSSALQTGHVAPFTTMAPLNSIKCSVDRMATFGTSAIKSGGDHMIQYNPDASSFAVTGDDAETRPVNMALNFLIKVKPRTDGVLNDIPLGAIIPFGAGDDKTAPAYPAWLRCQGQSVIKTTVTDLAALVGNRFAKSLDNYNFTTPDLRGKFIRGVDLNSKNDPDAGQRTPAPNGSTTGVGTTQASATKLKNPIVKFIGYSTFSNRSLSDNAPTNTDPVVGDDDYITNQSWSGGDRESRPVNVALHYYLNSIVPGSAQLFPVGGIIIVPGDGYLPQKSSWVLCDGSGLQQTQYPELYAVIGTTWGGTHTNNGNDTFNVPNLEYIFVRGAQTTADGSDPDFNSRTTSLYSKTVKVGSGSYQSWATGMPAQKDRVGNPKSLAIGIKYPSQTNHVMTTSSVQTWNCAGGVSGQTVSLSADWDNTGLQETAPIGVPVNFYIKAVS